MPHPHAVLTHHTIHRNTYVPLGESAPKAGNRHLRSPTPTAGRDRHCGTARAEIIEAHRAYIEAMSHGDTETLADLLSDGFTLTDMTGYVQPKNEWLPQMREGQFLYHSIDEKHMILDVQGDTARLLNLNV
ncbi:nuclear transport factor 2 family protein [Streptomyces sp. NPDC057199]|uniref:nuclear transport factor 2 family protein n=1 Tax=Streptomyces sp. NPDC057199 TaxID=3346047 RepID=UPI00363678D5